jgi:hypothetical protein
MELAMLPAAIHLAAMLSLSGVLAVFFCRPIRPVWTRVLTCCCLTFGIGIGVSSITFFMGLVIINDRGTMSLVAPIGAFSAALLLAFAMLRKREALGLSPIKSDTPANRAWPATILFALLLVAGACAVLHFMVFSTSTPHGEGDALAIWNLRARFLHRTGADWTAAFQEKLSWSHVDYPLLLPACIACYWDALGSETTLVPRAIAMGFTFGTVSILITALGAVRSTSQGLLAGLVILGGDAFLNRGVSQYADVPLAFFIVAALALIVIHDRMGSRSYRLLAAAGVCAGLATWTKNEGLLFLLCIGAAFTSVSVLRLPWRQATRTIAAFALGAIPILVIVFVFKIFYAGNNDLVSGQSWRQSIGRLLDSTRYLLICQHAVQQLKTVPGLLAVALAIHCLLVGKIHRQSLRLASVPMLCLAFMSMGYFLIYVTTPHDLSWHLETSLDRLMLHLFPAGVFSLFLVLGTIEEHLGHLQCQAEAHPDASAIAGQTPFITDAASGRAAAA